MPWLGTIFPPPWPYVTTMILPYQPPLCHHNDITIPTTFISSQWYYHANHLYVITMILPCQPPLCHHNYITQLNPFYTTTLILPNPFAFMVCVFYPDCHRNITNPLFLFYVIVLPPSSHHCAICLVPCFVTIMILPPLYTIMVCVFYPVPCSVPPSLDYVPHNWVAVVQRWRTLRGL